jgi:hypothetical protein
LVLESQESIDTRGKSEIVVLRQEEVRVGCPYCGEMIEILVDLSVGEQQYIEDCSVCCAPILMSVQVDEAGQFSHVDVKTDDE